MDLMFLQYTNTENFSFKEYPGIIYPTKKNSTKELTIKILLVMNTYN